MPKSECFCSLSKDIGFSCEPTVDDNIRFRYAKEEDCITDRVSFEGIEYKSGLTPNSIANCELKTRVEFKDKEEHFKEIEAQPKKHKRHHRGHHGHR